MEDLSTELQYDVGVYTNFTLSVPLAGPSAEPNPRTIDVHWHFERDLDGDPETRDQAVIAYQSVYWYRACTA